jgi:hypothetical protein
MHKGLPHILGLGWNVDFEDEERDGDGEDAVREGLQARGRYDVVRVFLSRVHGHR